jgi:polyisoprenyl-teichoic acid--peptidoglycan teichoic acid transferase
MRRSGCLTTVTRLVILITASGLILFLGANAVRAVRELARRSSAQALYEEQRNVFPTVATSIAMINSSIGENGMSGASNAGTEVEPPTATANEAEILTSVALLAPSATHTETSTNTPRPSRTPTRPTNTPNATNTNTATNTATRTPTNTAQLTNTATNTSTNTPRPSSTATNTDQPTNTATNTEPAVALLLTIPPTNTKRPSSTPAEPAATITTIPPTETLPPTTTPTVPATATPTVPTNTPTTLPPTITATFTETATAVVEVSAPTSTLPPVARRQDCPTGRQNPVPTAVPTAAPRLNANGMDIMNILLIGTDEDVRGDDPSLGTDTMLVVSVNRTANTVAMLSIPRDLYVCVPEMGMQRINVAYNWGEAVGWSPGGGFGLLQETIMYNMGIPIHFYAKVSLVGFRQIVDTLGGIEIAVDCPIEDSLRFQGNYNELATPIYEPFSQQPGYVLMDGSYALWYARNRSTAAGDFDRNRRQQQVLRAIWRTARDKGLITQAPQLWGTLTGIVETNMQLQDVLGLVPMATSLDPADISYYTMIKGFQTQHFAAPEGDVQIPEPNGFFYTLNNFYTPPSGNKVQQNAVSVEVVNVSGNENWDKLAADVLGWKGFRPAAMGVGDAGVLGSQTMIYDYTGGAYPEVVALMMQSLNLTPDRVISQPDPNSTSEFRVVIGGDYKSCTAPGFR